MKTSKEEASNIYSFDLKFKAYNVYSSFLISINLFKNHTVKRYLSTKSTYEIKMNVHAKYISNKTISKTQKYMKYFSSVFLYILILIFHRVC